MKLPIGWVSRIQTEIALLITESEYISLSQNMRDLIPFRQIMLDLSSVFGMKFDSWSLYTRTSKHNKVEIEFAKYPKYIPQTKHIFVKWHHFRENT